MGICCLLRNHRGRMSLNFVLARPSEDPPVSVTGLSICLAEPRVSSSTKPPLSFVTIPSLCCPEPSSTLTCRLQYSNIRYFFDVLNRLEHLKGTSCFVVFQLHHPIIFSSKDISAQKVVQEAQISTLLHGVPCLSNPLSKAM